MSAREELKKYPLTLVASSFVGGFAAGSGLHRLAGAAMVKLGRSESARRVAVVAWPLVKQAMKESVREQVVSAVRKATSAASESSDS